MAHDTGRSGKFHDDMGKKEASYLQDRLMFYRDIAKKMERVIRGEETQGQELRLEENRGKWLTQMREEFSKFPGNAYEKHKQKVIEGFKCLARTKESIKELNTAIREFQEELQKHML